MTCPTDTGSVQSKTLIHRRTTSCVYPGHTAHSDESHTLPASNSLQFTAVPPEQLSQVGTDVFQQAPFRKTPARRTRLLLDSALCSEPSDVFLQAPFMRRQEVPHSVSECSMYSGGPLRPTDAPVLQQPVAVHRVVSRVGQQAAVGSVAVGPLHSWTIAGRPTEDPFTAAPFNPRCSQEKL